MSADSQVHERAAEYADPRASLRAAIKHAGEAKGMTVAQIGDDFTGWAEGTQITEADEAMLTRYLGHLREAVTA